VGSSVIAAFARLLWQVSGAAAHARSSLTSLATGWRLRGCRVAAAVPAARALAGSSVAAAFAHLFWRVSGAAAHARSSLTSLATGWRLRGCRMATAVSAACALTGSPVTAASARLLWQASGAAAHARSSLTLAAARSQRLGCRMIVEALTLVGGSVATASARWVWRALAACTCSCLESLAAGLRRSAIAWPQQSVASALALMSSSTRCLGRCLERRCVLARIPGRSQPVCAAQPLGGRGSGCFCRLTGLPVAATLVVCWASVRSGGVWLPASRPTTAGSRRSAGA
jgi:hypothetical protein